MTTKEYRMIRIEALLPHPDNPRSDLGDPQKLAELANDLAVNGNTIPLRVFPLAFESPHAGRFLLIEGHRRAEAAKLGGVEKLYCWVDPTVDTLDKQIEAMLRENTHREGITPENEARAIQTMLDCEGMSVKKVAKRIHRSETFIRQRSQIAKLPDQARGLIDGGQLTLAQSHAFDEFRDSPAAIERLTRTALDKYSNNFDFDRQVLSLRMMRDKPMHLAESERVVKEFKVPTLTENQTYSGQYNRRDIGERTPEEMAKTGHFAQIKAYDGKLVWYEKVAGVTKPPATEEEIAERKRLKDLEAGLEQDLALWDEHLRRSLTDAGGGLPLTPAEKTLQAGLAPCVLRHYGDWQRAYELLLSRGEAYVSTRAGEVTEAVAKLRPLQIAMLMAELHLRPEKLHKPATWHLTSWSDGKNSEITKWINVRKDLFGYDLAVFEAETIDHFTKAGVTATDPAEDQEEEDYEDD